MERVCKPASEEVRAHRNFPSFYLDQDAMHRAVSLSLGVLWQAKEGSLTDKQLSPSVMFTAYSSPDYEVVTCRMSPHLLSCSSLQRVPSCSDTEHWAPCSLLLACSDVMQINELIAQLEAKNPMPNPTEVMREAESVCLHDPLIIPCLGHIFPSANTAQVATGGEVAANSVFRMLTRQASNSKAMPRQHRAQAQALQ